MSWAPRGPEDQPGSNTSFGLPGHESTSAELRRVRAERDEARAELRALTETDDARLASAEAESARANRERKEMYEELHSAVWQRDLARAELASARQEADRLRAGNAERYRQGALDAAGAVARVYREVSLDEAGWIHVRRCYRAALSVADPQPGTGDQT